MRTKNQSNRQRLLSRSWMRTLVVALIALNLSGRVDAAPAATASAGADSESPTYHTVKIRAAALAAQPFEKWPRDLPQFLADLNYDQYRDLRFHSEQGLWVKERLPFQVQFFSRGSIFSDRVVIHIVNGDQVTPVEFNPAMFDYSRLPVHESVPADLGFAGFRLRYPLNKRNVFDEVVAFLGASYFRAVGRNQVYGLSARGLALDTGMDSGEEFPVFREFWLEQPAHRVRHMTFYGLLDSPSVTGAYRFEVSPGNETAIDVTAHLYFRSAVAKLGVAPLSSMFWHGTNTKRCVDDFRPAAHDSDGLLIAAGNGERLWRPLNNPQRLSMSEFRIENPRGFGLLQRERSFESYQDLESQYQLRPSAWVEPVGDWGIGTVELVEIPTNNDYHDNIVAFWTPSDPVTAGSQRTFQYRVSFMEDPEAGLPGGRVVATRIGAGNDVDAGQRRFVVDFAGKQLAALSDKTPVDADIWSSDGKLTRPVVQRNPQTGGYRVFFEMTPGDDPVVELRCNLRTGPDAVSETWSYQWRREKH